MRIPSAGSGTVEFLLGRSVESYLMQTRTLELRDTREVPAIARAPKAPKERPQHRIPVELPEAVRLVASSFDLHVLGVERGAQIRQGHHARVRPNPMGRVFIALKIDVVMCAGAKLCQRVRSCGLDFC